MIRILRKNLKNCERHSKIFIETLKKWHLFNEVLDLTILSKIMHFR